jgi:hypothetical protein
MIRRAMKWQPTYMETKAITLPLRVSGLSNSPIGSHYFGLVNRHGRGKS